MTGKNTLVVNGVTYTNAVPYGAEQDILTTKEYMSYSLRFELDKDQALFEPDLLDGVVRVGKFVNYDGAHTEFPFFDHFAASYSTNYDFFENPRAVGSVGKVRYPNHGVETIKVDCWMVGQTNQNFQKYMSDFLMDPLGKQGTLNLNGLITQNAVLISVNSEPCIGASMKYSLEFLATLAC